MPFAFTEHGALMAASVLNTPRAVEVSLYVVRAFVGLREALATHEELAKRFDELESRLERKLATHGQAITSILEAIRQLMARPEPAKKRRIGYVSSHRDRAQSHYLPSRFETRLPLHRFAGPTAGQNREKGNQWAC